MLLKEELQESGALIVPVTADQFSWNLLQELNQQWITPVQTYKNIWKMTLLTAAIWWLHERKQLPREVKTQLSQYYPYMSSY
jgi:hypothetical protein